MGEIEILRWFESLHGSALDGIMTGASLLATSGIIWILIGISLILMKHPKDGIGLMASVVLAYIIVDVVLKPIVCRERPFAVEDLEVLGAIPTTWSFPSGHTASAFAGTVSILLINRKAGAIAVAFATLVGISRLYLCVHWPTDVLAGAVIGTMSAVAVYVMIKKAVTAENADDGV